MSQPGSAARRKPRYRERNAARETEPHKPRVAPARLRPSATVTVQARARAVVLPRITVEQAILATLLVAGFAVRFWDAGSRAMHGDEAVHAWLAWNLFDGTGYRYDPVYHGPFQFLVTTAFFFLFGVSNLTGRLTAILFGTGLIALPYFLRHWIGRSPALIAAGLIALSPAFVYVSRLERDDIFTCFFACVIAISLFSFIRSRQIRWLYLGSASTALSLTAMENTYITVFIFGSFLALVLMSEVTAQHRWGLSLVRFWSGEHGNRNPRSRTLIAAAVILLGSIVVTVITGMYWPVPAVLGILIIVNVTIQSSVNTRDNETTAFLAALRSIDRQQWLNAVTIVAAILVLSFSTFGTNLRGVWDSAQPLLNQSHACALNSYILNPCRRDIVGGLFYWLSQHNVHRGGQPWFYYSLLFGLYEQIALILGVAGIVWFLRKPTLFTAFVSYWAILSFGIYSWAGEKFSWLMIHPLLPFTLLAAMVLGELWKVVRPVRLAVGVLVGLLVLLELHNTYEVNFVNGADPVEMMVYVQSSPDTPKVAANVLQISNKATNSNDLPVTIDSQETWPFAWYLRDMTHVGYPGYPQILDKAFAGTPVILVDESHQANLLPKLHGQYSGHLYHLRWWFPEDYKALSWADFGRELIDPGYWRVVGQWLIDRRPFGPKQSVNFYYYVKKGYVSPF